MGLCHCIDLQMWPVMLHGKIQTYFLLLGLWFFLSPSLLGEGHRNLDTSDHYVLGREKYLSFLHSSKCHNLASLLMVLESWP